MSTGSGRRRLPRSVTAFRAATSIGSSTVGARGKTSWWGARARLHRIADRGRRILGRGRRAPIATQEEPGDGRPREDREAEVAGQAHGPRPNRPPLRRRHLCRVRLAGAAAGGARRRGGCGWDARRRSGHRAWPRRGAAGMGDRLRLHGDGGGDGGGWGGGGGEQLRPARVRELALRYRKPIVWLLDSAGARIQEASGSTFAGTGFLFYEQVVMSGVIPQVAAMLGPCAAGTAYIPGLSDFVPMVKGTSSMSLGGARLVKAATGEDVTDHDMGGSQVHCYESGVGDNEVADDAACIAAVRTFLSYLPSSNDEQAPFKDTGDPPDRLVNDLEKIVPTNPRAAYDVRRVVKAIFDNASWF